MAVLSKPIDDVRAPSALLCVIAGADAATMKLRVTTTLEGRHPDSPLVQIDAADELANLDVGPGAVIVLACGVDRPRDMAILRRLRRETRGPAIVAISPTATGTGVRRALDAGADAIVFEPELESTLAVAISAVRCGQSVVPRKVRASVERPTLSHRERQVLVYVSRGLTNAQIAERLFLSESTIKSHLSSAFTKFGVRSRREAAALFLELEATSPAALPEEEQQPTATTTSRETT